MTHPVDRLLRDSSLQRMKALKPVIAYPPPKQTAWQYLKSLLRSKRKWIKFSKEKHTC